MRVSKFITVMTVAICGLAAQSVSAQIVKELDLRSVLDVGPIDLPGCSCVAKPMTLPAFPIDLRWETGPATQLNPGPRPASEQQAFLAEAADLQAHIDQTVVDAFSGDADAAFRIAMVLATGVGVKADEVSATSWFMLAAANGFPPAATFAGRRILQGVGAPVDPVLAAQWFALGAKLGDETAMTVLGLLYASGQGVGQDLTNAVGWWNRVSGTDTAAKRFLADAAACGLGTQQDSKVAALLYRQSMREKGQDPWGSRLQLARMYRDECGVERDEKNARKLFEAGAEAGDPESQIDLGEMLLTTASGEQLPNLAYQWASFAAFRLPPGALRDRAMKLKDAAARLMDSYTREVMENMTKATIEASRPNPADIAQPR